MAGLAANAPIRELPMAELASGDLVPGDGRVLEARDFFVNQALLTGEAYPAEKQAGDLPEPTEDPDSVRNAVFMGTSVISGTARVLICRTGPATALGQIAGSLQQPALPTFGLHYSRISRILQ